MLNRLQSKSVILIGLGVLLIAIVLVALLSRQQTYSLSPVTWPLEQRRLSDAETQAMASSVEEARGETNFFKEITTPELKELFPHASFYLLCSVGPPQPCLPLIAVQSGRAYRLPKDFNRLLADTGIQATDITVLPIARAFIGIAHRGLLTGSRLKFYPPTAIDEADTQRPQYRYQWEIRAWSDEYGTLTDWKIGFHEGRIDIVLRTLLGRKVDDFFGAFNSDLDLFGADGLSIFAIPRIDTEYYTCCNGQGQLLMSYGQLEAADLTSSLPLEFAAEWQTAWESAVDKTLAAQLLQKARQLYPGQVDKSWSIEPVRPWLINRTSRQERFGLSIDPPITPTYYLTPIYFLLAAPFSWQSAPTAPYVSLIGMRNDKPYRLPEDFNTLLADANLQVTLANQADVAQDFIWATHRELVSVHSAIYLTKPKRIEETDPLHPTYHYQLEMDSWAEERGVWVKWKFGFENGRVAVVHYTVLGRFVGSWQSHLHPNVQDPFFTSTSKTYVCCDEKGALR